MKYKIAHLILIMHITHLKHQLPKAILLVLVFLIMFMSLSKNISFANYSAPTNFIYTNGINFINNGNVFKFTGVNMYDAAGIDSAYHFQCGTTYSDTQLDSTFNYLKNTAGISVIRFWAFQNYIKGSSYNGDWSHFLINGPDWTGIDRVISFAKKYDLKIIPVLENSEMDCSQGGLHKSASWYSQGYKSPYGSYPLSYMNYVKQIVARYKNESTIFSWMMMNEAEDDENYFGSNDLASIHATAMYNFALNVSQTIKSIDPYHLVTLGTIDGNRGGVGGYAYIEIHKLPYIDYMEAHDYNNEEQSLPGSGSTFSDCSKSIACIENLLTSINKPFIIGESGISLSQYSNRNTLFNNKMSAFFKGGGSGYLIWHWDPTTSQNYDISPNDPVVNDLKYYGYHPQVITSTNSPPNITTTQLQSSAPKATSIIIKTSSPSVTTTIAISPTVPITLPSCTCKTNNLCSNSCTFTKDSNYIYPTNISCNRENGLGSITTQSDQDSFCQRLNRTIGDADGDNKITPLDFFYYVRAINGGSIPSNVDPDINGDGVISPSDLIIIQNHLS